MNDIPTMLQISMYILIFLYGIVIGSFLNVVIIRVPRKESIVKVRSHCENCGYQLKWFDLIPIFSYLVLGGKCRKCKTKISAQHLILEVLNGILYVFTFFMAGFSLKTVLLCLLFSALLALSLIDFKTYEIPVGFQYVIFVLAVCQTILDRADWAEHVIGFFAVSVVLYLIYIISKGAAIGGGDVKLMAVCGLFVGWKLIIFAFLLGCIVGSVVHEAFRRKPCSCHGTVFVNRCFCSGVMGESDPDMVLGNIRHNIIRIKKVLVR
mgnify:CR=1 FL=1